MNFESVIDGVIAAEKGYTDNPADHGGPTNFGITQAVARANGYDGPMQEMPQSVARQIYRNRYIVKPGFDKIALISESIAAEMIDTGVNMGPNRPGEFLQRWLNGFNSSGSYYADVFVDGSVGEVTLQALRAYMRWRSKEGEQVMVCCLNSLQGDRYLQIAEADRSQRQFLYGWMRSRVLQPAAA